MALGILLLITALTNADLTGITPATQEEMGLSEVMVPARSHNSVGSRIVFYTYTCRWQVLLSYKLKSLVSFGWPLIFFFFFFGPFFLTTPHFSHSAYSSSNKESLCRPAFSHINIPNYYQHVKQKNFNCTVSVHFPCLMIQFLKENAPESVRV